MKYKKFKTQIVSPSHEESVRKVIAKLNGRVVGIENFKSETFWNSSTGTLVIEIPVKNAHKFSI